MVSAFKDAFNDLSAHYNHRQARSAVRQEKRHAAAEDSRLLLEDLPDDIKRMVNLAAEKGASTGFLSCR